MKTLSNSFKEKLFTVAADIDC